MARFLNHSYPGRKALLFVVEQSTVLASACMGAAATAAIAGGAALEQNAAPLPRALEALAEGPMAAQQVIAQALFAVGTAAMLHLPAALPWAVGATLVSAAALYAADLYDLRQASADRSSGGRRTLVALVIAALALGVAAAPGGIEARASALGAALAAAVAVVSLRLALPAFVGPPRRLLVVGAGRQASELAQALLREAEDRVEIAGFVPVHGAEGAVPAEQLVPGEGGIVAAAQAAKADWIALAVEDARSSVPADALAEARLHGIACFTPAMLAERLLRRIPVERLRASEIAFSEGFRFSAFHRFVKRTIDVTVAGVGLLLAAPLLVVAAAAIKLDSKGPLFYSQERVGLHGRPFPITKLRTMRVDAEAGGAPQWAKADDPRVTRVGRLLRKTRIDEIPQLLAVLVGHMSLVGPRPERPYFVEQLKQIVPWYGAREAVPPGVTGWAQIRYPYGASVEDAKAKLEYDLYYIKNGSAFLDLAILFHTVRHVLMGRGAR